MMKKKQKKRDIKLLVVISIVMVGMGALFAVLIACLLLFLEAFNVCLYLGKALYSNADRFASQMERYESLPWLLSYWGEHSEELTAALNEKDDAGHYYSLEEQMSDPCTVTVEEAESFTDEQQELFAEYCYLKLSKGFDIFDKSFFNITGVCFRPEGDTGFVYFYNESNGQEDALSLGSTFALDSQMKNVVTGSDIDTNSLTAGTPYITNNNHLFFVYRPIKHVGKTICVVVCSYEMEDVVRVIKLSDLIVAIPVILLLIAYDVPLMLLIYKKVIKPTAVVQKTVRKYTKTKDIRDIHEGLEKLLRKRDEYGRLSEDIGEMADNIDRYIEESKAAASEKQRLVTELETAETIQKSQLPGVFPAFPERSDFDLYAVMDPAKEVGGDFYDFFLIDEDHIALVIGDVSDKGIPAALVMMACRTLIRSTLLQGIAPAEAMTHVNRQICETNAAEMFVTVWVAVIDLSTGKGIEINAGHEKPVLRRAGEDFALIKNTHDMALGTWEEQTFTEQPFELHPGDMFFVYTDGVPEATSGAKELFGAERMLDALNEKPDLSPEEQIRHMEQSVNSFVGDAEQFDDMTMLCFSFSPSSLDDR